MNLKNLKEFLKPTGNKLGLAIIILVFSIMVFGPYLISKPEPLFKELVFKFFYWPVLLITPLLSFTWAAFFMAFAINVFYLYLLSCLIILIYDKVKKK